MFEQLEVLSMAKSMARHAGTRQALVAENIAHADTPGYQARDLPNFSESYSQAVSLSATRPGHLGSWEERGLTPLPLDLPASANGNTVSLETELLRSVEVKRQHDRALDIYQHSLSLMRTALGRR
ncbi:MAG: FlgB family protein [Pseudomonadota bacterium]